MDILDAEQAKSYQYISEQIFRNNKVDVNGNVSYLFAFLFETTRELLSSNNHENVLAKISQLQALYCEYSSLNYYCDHSTADILLCMGNYEESIRIRQKNITGKIIAVNAANMLINLKHKFEVKIQAEDLLSVSSKLTNYGKENIDDILAVMNVLLDEAYHSNQVDIIDEIVADEAKNPFRKREQLSLFWGNPFGYELNKRLVSDDLKKDYIFFPDNKKFIHLIKELSRVSENMLRETRGLPKVGEGWVNETKLYYAIKEIFPQYKIIHQYRCKWLGLQSLDIFVEELNIGIEYQGAQHLRPIDFFGGEEAFKKTQQRDRKKKSLCDKHGIRLIYVYENYDLKDVIDEINSYIAQDEHNIQIQANIQTPNIRSSAMSLVDVKAILNSAPLEDMTLEEQIFIDALCVKLRQNNFDASKLDCIRQSDKALEIEYGGSLIGIIKLQGRNTKMQGPIGEIEYEWFDIENQPIDAYVSNQSKWIEYLKILRH